MAQGVADAVTIRNGLFGLAAGLAVGAAAILIPKPYGLDFVLAALAASALGAVATGTRTRRDSAVAGALGHDPAALTLSPRARDVLERLPDPIMLLDMSGRVTFANRAMVAVVGTDTHNKHVSAVLRTPSVLQAVERSAAGGEPAWIDFSFHVPVERHYEAFVTRTEHYPHLTALLLHDVTAALRAEEARTDFIANASHELRTPLAAVSGFIDTLKGHARDDEKAREKFLDIMSVEAGRMRRLIDDLLSLTRIEQNEHVPPLDEVDIVEVVRDAAMALQGLAQLDGVTLSVAGPDNLPLLIGDRDELTQLFQNLIHNAIKYGRKAGNIQVVFSLAPGAAASPGRHSAGSFVAIAVKDDGDGIPREAIPRLTERFYRVDVKKSRERGGTGLGLAIVKHIVNRHHGKLQIDSKVGEGSTFTVLLPAAPGSEPGIAIPVVPASLADRAPGVTEVL